MTESPRSRSVSVLISDVGAALVAAHPRSNPYGRYRLGGHKGRPYV